MSPVASFCDFLTTTGCRPHTPALCSTMVNLISSLQAAHQQACFLLALKRRHCRIIQAAILRLLSGIQPSTSYNRKNPLLARPYTSYTLALPAPVPERATGLLTAEASTAGDVWVMSHVLKVVRLV